MSNKSQENTHPMGGWVGTIGAFIGLALAIDFGAGLVGALIGLVLGAAVGLAVEHILARILIFALGIIVLLARNAFFNAIF